MFILHQYVKKKIKKKSLKPPALLLLRTFLNCSKIAYILKDLKKRDEKAVCFVKHDVKFI